MYFSFRFATSFFGQRNVKSISSSSECVLPLSKQVVVDVFGKADKLRDVFLLDMSSLP